MRRRAVRRPVREDRPRSRPPAHRQVPESIVRCRRRLVRGAIRVGSHDGVRSPGSSSPTLRFRGYVGVLAPLVPERGTRDLHAHDRRREPAGLAALRQRRALRLCPRRSAEFRGAGRAATSPRRAPRSVEVQRRLARQEEGVATRRSGSVRRPRRRRVPPLEACEPNQFESRRSGRVKGRRAAVPRGSTTLPRAGAGRGGRSRPPRAPQPQVVRRVSAENRSKRWNDRPSRGDERADPFENAFADDLPIK